MNRCPPNLRWLPWPTVVAGLLASCDDPNPRRLAALEAEHQQLELTQRINLAKLRLAKAPPDLNGQLAEVRSRIADLTRRTEALTAQRGTLQQTVADLETCVARCATHDAIAIREARRAAAVGTRFPEFLLADGRKFREVEVTAIDDVGITVRHADGLARFNYFALTPEQRERFGLQETAATAGLERERRDALAYDRWIEEGMVAVRKQQAEDAAISERESELARERMRAAASRAVAAANPLGAIRVDGAVWRRSWIRTPYLTYNPYFTSGNRLQVSGPRGTPARSAGAGDAPPWTTPPASTPPVARPPEVHPSGGRPMITRPTERQPSMPTPSMPAQAPPSAPSRAPVPGRSFP